MFWNISYNQNYRSDDGTVHRVVNWREFGTVLRFGCGNELTSSGSDIEGATKDGVTCIYCIARES